MSAKENVVSKTINRKVAGKSGSDVCDKMNEEYNNIKLITVTPIKGEVGQFNVYIEIYDPDVWMVPQTGFWPIKRKSKSAHMSNI